MNHCCIGAAFLDLLPSLGIPSQKHLHDRDPVNIRDVSYMQTLTNAHDHVLSLKRQLNPIEKAQDHLK